jgi:hypothetical protein
VLLIQEFRCSAAKFFGKGKIKALLQELGYGVVIINACEYNIGYAGRPYYPEYPY